MNISTAYTESDLQDLINIVFTTSIEARLDVNILKTKCMIISGTDETE